jgi:hypothetical protein
MKWYIISGIIGYALLNHVVGQYILPRQHETQDKKFAFETQNGSRIPRYCSGSGFSGGFVSDFRMITAGSGSFNGEKETHGFAEYQTAGIGIGNGKVGGRLETLASNEGITIGNGIQACLDRGVGNG